MTAIFTIKMELQSVYHHLRFTGSHKCVCHIWGRGLILCRTYQINCSSHTVVLYWSGLAETPQRNKRGRKQTQTRRRPSVMAVNCPAAIFLRKWGRIVWKSRGTNMEALPRKQNPTKGGLFWSVVRVLGQASISCRTSIYMFSNQKKVYVNKRNAISLNLNDCCGFMSY